MREVIYIGTTKVEYDNKDKRTAENLRKASQIVNAQGVPSGISDDSQEQEHGEVRPSNYREDN